jgi:hypothetical protein
MQLIVRFEMDDWISTLPEDVRRLLVDKGVGAGFSFVPGMPVGRIEEVVPDGEAARVTVVVPQQVMQEMGYVIVTLLGRADTEPEPWVEEVIFADSQTIEAWENSENPCEDIFGEDGCEDLLDEEQE